MVALSKHLADLTDHFGSKLQASRIACGELTIEVTSEDLLTVCKKLRNNELFAYEQLLDVCSVDYLTFGEDEWQTDEASGSGFGRGVDRITQPDIDMPRRYAVVYHLLSITHNQRLRLKVFCDGEPPVVPSVIDIWAGADWFEREVFDMMGILFDGHPDLRRILTDYGFIGHPLRKDFPISGHVEVRFDPEQGRVIYQPVSIEPRVLVPKVIRHDHRSDGQAPNSQEAKNGRD